MPICYVNLSVSIHGVSIQDEKTPGALERRLKAATHAALSGDMKDFFNFRAEFDDDIIVEVKETASEPVVKRGSPTFTATCRTQSEAELIIKYLVESSQWFQVEPLPDDYWEITVKKENEAHLTHRLQWLRGEE